MLFMILVKGSQQSEAAILPNDTLMRAMTAYNQELVAAGIRRAAMGLHPTKDALRLSFREEGHKPILEEGPFEPASEQLAGFFLIEVKDKDEALYWFNKAPDPIGHGHGLLELRQVYE